MPRKIFWHRIFLIKRVIVQVQDIAIYEKVLNLYFSVLGKKPIKNIIKVYTFFSFSKDRHIKGRSVIIDKQQDWRLLSSSQKNGYSIFKFTRPIVSCDQDDRHIEVNLFRAILI